MWCSPTGKAQPMRLLVVGDPDRGEGAGRILIGKFVEIAVAVDEDPFRGSDNGGQFACDDTKCRQREPEARGGARARQDRREGAAARVEALGGW